MPAKFSPSDRQDAYLHDMLESAKCIMSYMDGVTFEEFQANSEKRDAVALRLSVIGEAARNISETTEALLPTIPFRAIRGMRNRITHDYGHVNFRIVWEVTQRDIADLFGALEHYFAARKAGDLKPPQTAPPFA